MPLGDLSNPKHPLWGFLKFALVLVGVMAAATVVMYRHASNFDETEIAALKELLIILLAGGGLGGIREILRRRSE